MALIEKLPLEIDALSLLSEALNFDFATKGMDEPFTDEELAGMSGAAGHPRPRRCRAAARRTRRCATSSTISGRGRLHDADASAARRRSPTSWRSGSSSAACDGFVLAASHLPGAYEDFVSFVVPELQRRGLFRKEYCGITLRENLGLPVPAVAAWCQQLNLHYRPAAAPRDFLS